ncbi:Uncharacterised protein [Acinetobacter baumannii]|nr:Uncharacterised protein [Acinetobacter baumannii]
MAIPTSAVHHIQNSAPGPPRKIAVATPAMLPVPTVAARQVISAWNGLISPLLSSSLLRPCQSRRKPTPRRTRGMNFNPSIRYRPVPRISTSINGPQTTPFRSTTHFCKLSISDPYSCSNECGLAAAGIRNSDEHPCSTGQGCRS